MPFTLSQIEDFAGEPVQAVAATTHNQTWLGATCFIKAFGSINHWQREIKGLTFLADQGLPSLPILDKRAGLLKLPLATPMPHFDAQAAGTVAHRLHSQMSIASVDLIWDDINQMRARQLQEHASDLALEMLNLSQVAGSCRQVALHCDLNRQNMVTYQDETVIIDWEWLSCGPAEYDFTAAWLGQHAFGRANECDDLIDAYASAGGQIDEQAVMQLGKVRALHSIAWCFEKAQSNPVWRDEARARVHDYRSGFGAHPWGLPAALE